MLKFTPFPFFRITIVLACGILFAKFFNFQTHYIFYASLLVYLILLLAVKSKIFSFSIFFGIAGWLTLFSGGNSIYHQHTARQNPRLGNTNIYLADRFLLWIDNPQEKKGERKRGVGRVLGYHFNDEWKTCDYKIILTAVNKVDVATGNLMLVKSSPDSIKSPKNPGEFSFKNYYATLDIYLTEYLTPAKLIPVGSKEISFHKRVAFQVRDEIEKSLDRNFGGTQEGAILKAITIGQKNEIQSEVKSNFSNSGTMHVLAVSGLHVGIVYGIFLFFTQNLMKTQWKYLVVFLMIIFLWFYAIITGLSPSVVRAVTMFSILALGKLMLRKGNAFNLVFASAFFLLILNPNLLFMVGFQLSYLAVLSILYFSPKLMQIEPPGWLPVKVWTLLIVSISAQIGTTPLSLYYFQQFPTYFLISNLVIIPIVFLVLNGAIFYLAAGVLEPVQKWIAWLLEKLVFLMLTSVEYINKLPGHIISTKIFTSGEAILLYVYILLFSLFWTQRNFNLLKYATLILVIFSLHRFYSIWTYYNG